MRIAILYVYKQMCVCESEEASVCVSKSVCCVCVYGKSYAVATDPDAGTQT